MRRLVFSSLAFQLFAVTAPAAVEVIDDRRVVLRRDSPAQRVIALAPHLTELVFAAGAGNRLVGKVRGSGNRIADVERLERLGFAVLVLEPRRLEDIPRHMRMLGVLLGTGGHAQAAALAFVSRADRLRERYRGKPAVSVLFQAWHQPLITVSADLITRQTPRVLDAAEKICAELDTVRSQS